MKCWPNVEPRLHDGWWRPLPLLFACLVCFAAHPAVAQQAPGLGYAYPPAVRIGETTEVALGGYDLTDDAQYFLHHSAATWQVDGRLSRFYVPPPPYWFGEKGRLAAFPIPREAAATVTVQAAAKPGLALWQVANANGVSATSPIYLSDTPEIQERRWRDQPQSLPALAVGEKFGVSGRLGRIAEVDVYQLQVESPTEVHVDLMARRLGADFHAILTVEDEQGDIVADAADTRGADLQVSFLAAPSRTYSLKLHDVDYRGNRAFVYRLGLTAGARVQTHLPTRVVPGKQALRCLGPDLDETTTVDCGANQDAHIVKTSRGEASVRLPILSGFPEPESVCAGPEVDLVDHGDSSLARSIAWDLTHAKADASARFRWQLRLAPGRWQLDAASLEVGGGLDLALDVLDVNGKSVARNDDGPGGPDARVVFNVAKEAVYQLVVDELSGMVGRFDSIGRVSVQPARERFSVSSAQQFAAPVGGKITWKFTAVRSGYEGPIQLDFEGLPAGVALPEETAIPEKKNSVALTLQVAEDAPAMAAAVRVWATGDERVAVTSEIKGLAGNVETAERFIVAVTLQPKYKLLLIDKNRQRAVHRGTTYPAPFVIEREAGFDGAVRMQMAAKQGRHRQGIDGPIITVPAGVNEALYPCAMPEWLETDRTTRMVVLGVATQRDPQGNPREVTQAADARITMILEGALLSVRERKQPGDRGEHVARLGDVIRLPFRISRSQKLPLPVLVELELPAELATLCEVSPVQLSAEQQVGEFQIQTDSVKDSEQLQRLLGAWPLTMRATAMQSDRWPVVSETEVTVTLVE